MTRKAPLALVLCVAVLLAGCGGTSNPPQSSTGTTPSVSEATTTDVGTSSQSTGGPGTTTTTERGVAVVGGTPPVDPARQFARIENITGYDAEPPDRIVFEEPDDMPDVDPKPSPFESYLGFSSTTFTISGGSASGKIQLNETMGPTETESVLAHELHHVLFAQRHVDLYGDSWTSQDVFLVRSITEGSADYVQQRYWEQYLAPNGSGPAASLRQTYRNGSPMKRQARAPYYFGYRYISHRIDSAKNLSSVYERPPKTTEELIHLRPPGSEPVAPLSVATDDGSGWNHYLMDSPDTRGELFLRHALQVGVNDSAAARAAAGWGNDELLTFRETLGETNGYVWVLRFDDATNASEFRTVFETYSSNRGERDGSVWTVGEAAGSEAAIRPVALDDETVAVALGPRDFVRNVTVTGGNETIHVQAP